jgi:uncharacterized protein (DUF2344 family)
MEINEAIQETTVSYQYTAERFKEDAEALQAWKPPIWLYALDVKQVSVMSIREPHSYTVRVVGGRDVVTKLQRRTKQILTREVDSYDGDVSFKGQIGNIRVIVQGTELKVAPNCKIEEYTVEAKRYKVVCEEVVT